MILLVVGGEGIRRETKIISLWRCLSPGEEVTEILEECEDSEIRGDQ